MERQLFCVISVSLFSIARKSDHLMRVINSRCHLLINLNPGEARIENDMSIERFCSHQQGEHPRHNRKSILILKATWSLSIDNRKKWAKPILCILSQLYMTLWTHESLTRWVYSLVLPSESQVFILYLISCCSTSWNDHEIFLFLFHPKVHENFSTYYSANIIHWFLLEYNFLMCHFQGKNIFKSSKNVFFTSKSMNSSKKIIHQSVSCDSKTR